MIRTGWLLAVASALLAACGVGGEGTGAPVAASGRIDGFGSIVVAGERLDDRNARLRLEIDPREAEDAPLTALRLGMPVQASLQDGRVAELRIAPLLIAPVGSVDAATQTLQAAGQTVRVDAVNADPTTFEGLRDLAELEPGEWIVVYGQRNDSGLIRASHLGRAEPGPVRVVGAWQAPSAIGALPVDAAAADRLPAGFAPAPGDGVIVLGVLTPAGVLRADLVARDAGAAAAAAAGPVLLQGLVTAWQGPERFVVRGQAVDATSADVSGPLGSGRLVTLRGVLEAGVLRARSVHVTDDGVAPATELTAAISDFAGAAAFRVRGMAVDASGAALEGLTATNLGNGVRVRVHGVRDGATVRAERITLEPLVSGEARALVGLVEDFEPAAGRFRLAGVDTDLRLNPAVRYVGGSSAGLVDGALVRASGLVQGGLLVVTEVSFVGLEVSLAGVAANVEGDASGGGFDLGLADVVWNAATVFVGTTGTFADLVDARFVRVTATSVAGVLTATRIDARTTLPGQVVLRGTVEDFVAPRQWRLGGQRIDARSAVFDPPELANVLPGADVLVEGVLVDGVVQATRVSDP